MIRCEVPGCGRCFHRGKCVESLMEVPGHNSDKDTLVCPRHMCMACLEVPERGRQLITCIRCPAAYHKHCVPAGCMISGRNMLCPKHDPQPAAAMQWNVDCCVLCGGGGAVNCCDTCIGAYHSRCIKHVHGFKKIKSGTWQCPDCHYGLRPALGALVWVKVQDMPLWPAEIVNDAPPAIGVGPEGAFQVKLFGLAGQAKEFQWAHHAHVVQWQTGDEERQHSLDESDASGFPALPAALLEAKSVCNTRGPKPTAMRDQPRVTEYKSIVRSIRMAQSPKPKKDRGDDMQECSCTRSSACKTNKCLNRLCYVECDPKTCPAGKACGNRRFQKRQYPKLRHFKVKKGEVGVGLRALEDIKADQFVIEYCGEVIDKSECVRRVQLQEEQGHMMFYAVALDANHYVDAAYAGNLSRFVNHSCTPNCRVEKWNVLGETRVGFFAKQKIEKGTELTIDYQFSTIAGTGLLTGMQKCSCGSPRCRGFLGAKVGGAETMIRPEWCETLEVGMQCDAQTTDGSWERATVKTMDDKNGVTQLLIHFAEEQEEWIPITAMMTRMAPSGAMTSPEAIKRLEELRKQQELEDAEKARQEEVKRIRGLLVSILKSIAPAFSLLNRICSQFSPPSFER